MGILQNLEEWSDPRAKGYFLVGSPLQAFGVLAAYLVFSIWIGPMLMANRKPFKLNTLLQIYNLLQISLCAIYGTAAIYVITMAKLSYLCEPLTRNYDYWSLKVVEYHWYFFLFKIFDFTDTLFFVLRKKNNQITFLHMYHHVAMYIISWTTVKFFSGGQSALTGVVNSYVHVFMYIYYFLTALGPEYRRYTWWKVHVTQLQLVQFVIIAIQNTLSCMRDCGAPKVLALFFLVQAVAFLYLFGKFYLHTYLKIVPSSSTKAH